MVKHLTFTLFLLGCLAAAQDRYRIETIAGTPAPENVPATSTYFSSPQGLAFDSAGNLYVGVVNQAKVKRIDKGTTNTHTVAGNGLAIYSGDGGPALQAGLNAPRYPAFNAAGDMFISEWNSCVIRKVDHVTQVITTYAGNGTCGYSGDGGLATAAQLRLQRGITVDSAGNLYIADTNNMRVRRVDAATQVITTVAGTAPPPALPSGTPLPPYGDGGLATEARLRSPFGVAFDSGGDMYVIDKGACTIRRVDHTTGIISTYAGTAPLPPVQCGYSGDGGPATAATLSSDVRAIAFDRNDNLYLLDSASLVVRVVWRATGIIDTYAGDGTFGYQAGPVPARSAKMAQPQGLAVDRQGDVYIADWGANSIGRVSHGKTPTFTLYAGSLGPEGTALQAFLNRPNGVAVKPSGELLIAEGLTSRIREVNNSGLISTVAGVGIQGPYQACSVPTNCYLNTPDGIVTDSSGSFYFAEMGNCVVRKVDSGGVLTDVAGTGDCSYVDPVTQLPDLQDSILATTAHLYGPVGITIDAVGDIGIADYGSNRVVGVTTDGIIHNIAGGQMDADGNLIYGYRDGPAQSPDPNLIALLNTPYGVAVDAARTVLYFADANNGAVRKVDLNDPFMTITTVAGTGTPGWNDDGPLTSAQLSWPSDVWLNAAGDLFIVDDVLIRCIRHGSDRLVTIAGNHELGPGYSGDGGPATSAQLIPGRMTGDAAGRLYVADDSVNVVRRLTPQYLLTTSVNPLGGGTVTPGGFFDKGTVVAVSATPNTGYTFTGFSGAAGGSTSPVSVTMDSTKNVAANFTAFASPSIAVAITGAANGQGNNERNYTLQLKNNGTGLGTACQITALSAATLVGNGNVNIKTKLPLAYGDLGTASKVIEANVPPKVQQFSLTAAGSCQNTAWQTVPFSTTMTVAR